MKRIYLFIFILSFFTVHTQAQKAYVVGNAKVKIEPKTLVYFGDDFHLENGVSQSRVVENAGNVKINGSFLNNSSLVGDKAKAEAFVSTWIDDMNYGQVIIDDNSSAGLLSMEKGVIDPAIFPWGQFSVPFVFANANMAFDFLFDINYQNFGRYEAPMMRWHNLKFRFDHLSSATGLAPTDYLILNLFHAPVGLKSIMENNTKLTFRGIPSNTVHSIAYDGANYSTSPWSVWGNQQNYFGEKYKTYITDPLRSHLIDDENYGKYLYQLGNPYTSNIDLRKADLVGVIGVVKYTGLTWDVASGVGSAIAQKATYNEGVWVGDKEAVIVKPFEPFQIAYQNNASYTFTFNDGLKTFNTSDDLSENIDGVISGRVGFANNYSVVHVPNIGAVNEDLEFHQLGLNLYNAEGEPVGNRVFVAVTPIAENGMPNSLEAEYYDFENRTGFYLGQEREDGGIVKTSTRKMDINTINPSFINKSIPLFFNRESGDNEGYYLKADLFFGSIFNQLSESETNFANGNSFYFYDSKNNTFIPVTTDFSFYIEPENIYGAKVRYELYWNGNMASISQNDDLNFMEIDQTGKTFVYKSQEIHKVKFNHNWTKADVNVYDIYGMNVLSFSNVNTAQDLVLDLMKRGVYFVRAESSTGELYVQKIIK